MSASSPVRWLCEERSGEQVVFRIGCEGEDLVAEFVGVATLRAHRSGSVSSLSSAVGASPTSVAKLASGPVRALLRHLQGKLTLHAAAVAVDGLAVICLGASGDGKSTAAAELCLRPGFELVSDDTAAIELDGESLTVTPTESVHWLLPAARTALGMTRGGSADKDAVRPRSAARAETQLAAACRLVFDDDIHAPRTRRLHGRDAFAAIASCCVRFSVDDSMAHLHELDQLTRLLRHVPVYELRRPRRLTQLRGTGDLLEAIVRLHAGPMGDRP